MTQKVFMKFNSVLVFVIGMPMAFLKASITFVNDDTTGMQTYSELLSLVAPEILLDIEECLIAEKNTNKQINEYLEKLPNSKTNINEILPLVRSINNLQIHSCLKLLEQNQDNLGDSKKAVSVLNKSRKYLKKLEKTKRIIFKEIEKMTS